MVMAKHRSENHSPATLWGALKCGHADPSRPALRNRIVQRYMPLVHSTARAIHRRIRGKVELEDLAQEGAIGLCDAVERFEPQNGDAGGFVSFARQRIFGQIMDSLRKLDWTPRSLRGLEAQARRIVALASADGDVDLLPDLRSRPPHVRIERLDLLEAALRGLSERHRSVLVLHAGEGMIFRDIGRRFGMTHAGAFKIYREALQRIEEKALFERN